MFKAFVFGFYRLNTKSDIPARHEGMFLSQRRHARKKESMKLYVGNLSFQMTKAIACSLKHMVMLILQVDRNETRNWPFHAVWFVEMAMISRQKLLSKALTAQKSREETDSQ